MSRVQQLPLHGRDGHNAVVSIQQMQTDFIRLHFPCFQREDTREDLKTIGYAVLHFSKQYVLVRGGIGLLGSNILALDQAFYLPTGGGNLLAQTPSAWRTCRSGLTLDCKHCLANPTERSPGFDCRQILKELERTGSAEKH